MKSRDYARLAAPEPDVLRAIGEESKRNGTASLSLRRIDRAIRAARKQKRLAEKETRKNKAPSAKRE